MARKDVIAPYAMFGSTGCDVSQSSTTSNISSVQYMDNIGIAVNWSGSSPVGNLYFDVSNDYNSITGNAGTWVTLDFGSAIAISGNTGSHSISINQLPYAYLRARYVKTSGTGTLYAVLSAKQLGG